MRRRHFSAALLTPLFAPLRAAAGAGRARGLGKGGLASYLLRDDAMRFAGEVAKRADLPLDWVRGAIGQALFNERVQRQMRPAAAPEAAQNWALYRSRLVEPVRIRAAAAFWRARQATLARAQGDYGVPPEIVVGILGVETLFGQQMGRFRVIDALATLAFDFPAEHPRAPARQAFFQGELEQFLLLCRQAGLEPGVPLGSYAGAMGMPQFMPSSWLRYAVDYDGDGGIDLWRSAADAIGSVANYLKAHEWQPGLPAFYPVRCLPQADLADLLAAGVQPALTPADLTARGAQLPPAGLAHPGLLALVELQNGDPAAPGNEPLVVAGTENFYALTRYNQSACYAMAVLELGQAAAAALGGA